MSALAFVHALTLELVRQGHRPLGATADALEAGRRINELIPEDATPLSEMFDPPEDVLTKWARIRSEDPVVAERAAIREDLLDLLSRTSVDMIRCGVELALERLDRRISPESFK